MSEVKENETTNVEVTPRRLVTVHQIDREAYAQTAIVREDSLWEIRAGDWDRFEGVQAFARHRILVEQLTADQCAELALGGGDKDAVSGMVASMRSPYESGRAHAYHCIRNKFPRQDHSQFCVCDYCVNLRGKYSEEC